MNKPPLNEQLSIQDFRDFYWLKEELIAFCRTAGLSTRGAKKELAERIASYLQMGAIPTEVRQRRNDSHFDWKRAPLSLDTQITDNYKNTENVRAFFIKEIGPHFRFNTYFMNWTKQNAGKTLQEAKEEWIRFYSLKKENKDQSEIPAQFEYNTYIRDFLKDNENKTFQEAIQYWKVKRTQRGSKKYKKTDLRLLHDTRHTSNDLSYLQAFAPGYSDEKNYLPVPAVTDKKMITASGIAPIEFAREIFTILQLWNEADIDKWFQLFKHGVWNE
ncbi:MAG TPA: hypothetical protein DDW85_00310 [Porphyromonadaceae bacterium]|nr:hypothetical protein [Porphyromonadaceae bacterium]